MDDHIIKEIKFKNLGKIPSPPIGKVVTYRDENLGKLVTVMYKSESEGWVEVVDCKTK